MENIRNNNPSNTLILVPYIKRISPQTLYYVLLKQHNETAKILIKRFPECIFYVNYITFSTETSSGKRCHTLLIRLLILQRNYELLKFILENGAEPNICHVAKNTTPFYGALLDAVMVSNVSIINLLLQHGSNPYSLEDAYHITPQIVEIEDELPNINELLNKFINIKIPKNKIALIEQTKAMIPFHAAIRLDVKEDIHLAIIQCFIDNNVSVTKKSANGLDAIGAATIRTEDKAIKKNCPATTKTWWQY